MHIWPNGITYPCCLATNEYKLGNTNDSSFHELWNSERMKELRLNILNDAPTAGCSRCYEHESNGVRSMRMDQNHNMEHHINRAELTNKDGSLDDIFMAYMDIRFSNICNFKCKSCGPELSSYWVDDAVKLGRYSKDSPRILKIKNSLEDLWSDMEHWINTVESIYFAGGEPLIMDEHYKILEHLVAIGKTDISINYNTNFSKLKYKDKDVLELWKNFRHVKIGASLDASGSRAEHMRKGTVWKDIVENRKLLAEKAPHVYFQISCTVSAFNAEHCFDFFDEWIENGWVTPDQISINILLFPEYMRAQVLPIDNRQKIQSRATAFLEKHDIQNVDVNGRTFTGITALIKSLNTGKEELQEDFIKYNNSVDEIRHDSTVDVFPELSSIWK